MDSFRSLLELVTFRRRQDSPADIAQLLAHCETCGLLSQTSLWVCRGKKNSRGTPCPCFQSIQFPYCGVKPPMNVPQFAFTVRGAYGMYSFPIQIVPFSSETA